MMGGASVNKSRFSADDSDARGNKGGNAEVLAAHGTVLTQHGPGVACEKVRLMLRQGPS